MFRKGEKIGPYTLVEKLGRGSFGVVWLAEKRTALTVTRVALKSPNDEDIELDAIRQEASVWVAASGHPNIIPIIEADIYEGQVVIVSEYAPDGSLSKWLKDNSGKAPDYETAIEMTLGILNGLEHLHARKIIHRDLKPANILLQGKTPRLVDFGLSRVMKSSSHNTTVSGTFSYMPPEAFDGKHSPQTDIWATGVMLYEMLSGSLPYPQGEMTAIVAAVLMRPPEELPASIPEKIRRVVEKALKKNLSERYKTVSEMREDLINARRAERISPTVEIEKTFAENPTEKAVFTGYETLPLISPSEKNYPLPISPNDGLASQVTAASPQGATDEIATREKFAVGEQETAASLNENKTKEDKTLLLPEERLRAIASSGGVEKNQSFQFQDAAQNPRKIEVKLDSPDAGNFYQNEPDFLVEKKSGGGLFWAAGAVALVFLLVFGVWMLSGDKKDLRAGGENPTNAANVVVNSQATNINAKPTPNSSDSQPKPPTGMVYVAGGDFTMGRDDGEIAEQPPHKASVRQFFIDRTEVTNEDYAKFIKDADHKPPLTWKDGNYPSGDGLKPVTGVNWDDANAYAKWAGKRLPTEEEWEFAARGTTGNLYPWGNRWEADKANANGASRAVMEVGKTEGKSPFGIYDMVGNAWEWTADEFKPYPNGKMPPNLPKGKLRVLRGGSFESSSQYATTTYRAGWLARGANTYDQTSFRCVKDVKE